MKKLMIAAVAMMLGIVANAASVTWSVSNNGATDKGGVTLAKGSTIYFLLASDQADIVEALNNGQDFSAFTLDSAKTTNTRGYTAVQTVTGKGLPTAGTSTDFKILVVDTTSVSGETWYKFSATVSADTYDESATTPVPTKAAFASTAWSSGTEWTKVAPEPTSGLLLLIGMAGLALRRRRA